MNETEKIVELDRIINKKASDKLNDYIKILKLCDIDKMNTHIEIPVTAGYICNETDGKDRAGKRFIRGDEFLSLLQKTIYKNKIVQFQNEERQRFLNDLQRLRDYLDEDKSSLSY